MSESPSANPENFSEFAAWAHGKYAEIMGAGNTDYEGPTLQAVLSKLIPTSESMKKVKDMILSIESTRGGDNH